MATLNQTISLAGDQDLIKVLRQLKGGAVRAIMRPAIRRGVKMIAAEAKKNAQAQFKNSDLADIIDYKAYKSRRGAGVIGKVFCSDKKCKDKTIQLQGRTVPLSAAANIQEFGRHKGDLKPHPFMRPAVASKTSAAMDAVKTEAAAALERLRNKLHQSGKNLGGVMK